MRIVFTLIVFGILGTLPFTAYTQTCGPDPVIDTSGFSGTAFFNFGSSARLTSQQRRMSVAVGQTFVGYLDGLENNSTLGFYSRYLLPPFAVALTATQGDLLDRIQLSWEIDALGPTPNEGFNIYRDGIFLAAVGSNIRTYNDFNVIAGTAYNYEVRGLNIYGEGASGRAIGFQVPNGTVTGWVQTPSGRPVPDALVALTPLQGFSLQFGPTDGAFAPVDTALGPFLPASGAADWTLTFWMKTDSAGANAGVLQLLPFPLFIRALPSSGGTEGVEVATTALGPTLLSAVFPDTTKNGWQHLALTYDGSTGLGRLYLNGVLVSLSPLTALPSADEINLGSRTGTGGWKGCMDELRIYHRRLDELDLGEVQMGTASSLTPGLTHYWKFDEERGVKSFDVVSRYKLYFCGAAFKLDRPYVRTMGKTNAQGYYRIESASYGTGTTFLAEPMKDFYLYRALRFVRDSQDYATLPDFSLTPKATLELWVNSAGPDGEQCLLSKKWPGNDFRLLLKPAGLDNSLWVYLNGQEHNFGTLSMGYQHIAFTIDSSGADRLVSAYKNGVLLDSHTFNGVTGNWSDTTQVWYVGARPSGMGTTDNFGGLIDEIALYDTTLSVAAIQDHFQKPRDAQGRGLRVYFSMDEGNGNRLNTSGSLLLPFGTIAGADWSVFAARQTTTPHLFTPETRQVTLNPSVTSVDQVDFVDRSTVPVSGFVRYKNTDCFAPNVEILVNGARFNPAIFTDSTGKFVIDFDPGATAELTPVFEDHVFTPAKWEVTNVSSPIAGILFNDITTRKVTGQVAGGLCKKSVIEAPPGTGQGTVCRVQVRSIDGCLERELTIDNQEGFYEFEELPPLEAMTVAVVEHSNPDIKAFFQVEGGSTVNISTMDTVLDFIYFAEPRVQIASGLDTVPGCSPGVIVLDQGSLETLVIQLVEVYVATPSDDGICPLDTANFRIINGIADQTIDTAMANGMLEYQFRVGDPNVSPPYLKTLQIIGTSLGDRTGSLTRQAVVTGVKEKLPTFTSKLPERPFFVLHDPPGDGSFAFLEKDSSICYSTEVGYSKETTLGGGATLNALPTITFSTGFLFETQTELKPLLGETIQGGKTVSRLTDTSFQTCISFEQRIATDDGSLIVGGERGGDVFMGAAQNIIFGNVDKVTFDTCTVSATTGVQVTPGDFATTFIYSEFNIRNYVIPNLNKLLNDPATSSGDSAVYAQSIIRWQNILADNDMRKANANAIRNISFDAGVSYEYSEKVDTMRSFTTGQDSVSFTELDGIFGFYVNSLGANGFVNFASSNSRGQTGANSVQYGTRVGFALKDDDPGDFFSVDICLDSAYSTPLFKLRAGQSSCPWEPGTANREGPNLQLSPGSDFTAVNVPAHEPAVFQLTLGNESASNEDWTYAFTSVATNNPFGAVIRLNGQPLNYLQKFIIPYGTSTPVTLTVERGPVEYRYDSLLVALVSECEFERNQALSLPLAGDPKFFSPIYLGVRFIQPCSEVDINVPEQNWVVINNDPDQPGTLRRITTSGYDLNATDFQLVRVQYRLSNGDGAWINLPTPDGVYERYNPNWSGYDTLPNPKPPTLGPDFTQFFWETAGLSDGEYEIHAWAVCTGDASNKPGFSDIIKGRIDREPPSILGVPEPTDRVYHVGDEISFTFNQEINCDRLIPADQTQLNNVGLYDATTDQLIDISVTCYENKLIIDPTFDNKFFENRLIRAELAGIEDLVGNEFNGTEFNKGIWEFYVDRNELAWLTDSLGMTKYEDENKTVTANIHNRGGYPVPFTISGVPDWVRVVPDQGTLAANEMLPVSFYVDSSLAFGRWSDSIFMKTETGQNPFFMGGTEGLPVGVRVVCRPPFGPVNGDIYENTMSLVLKLDIEGVFSTDVEDIVAAYIDGELRGRTHVQYVPQLDAYLAYLTVYGDPSDMLKPLNLEIWDASECRRYGEVLESFTFQPDNVIGIPDNPQIVHTSGLLLREVPFNYGWNWLSFNLMFPDNSLNAALSSLKYPDNNLIRSQSAFATYSGGSWFGTLGTLGNTSMYIHRTDQPDTLRMLGLPLNPATTNIPVVAGWNWIGYIPNYSLPINDALASLPAQYGDIVKSQYAFAQYLNPTFGWVGSLKYLSPPNGYQVKLAQAGTLTYPPPVNPFEQMETEERGGQSTALWTVNPAQYEHSSTLIGMLSAEGVNATAAGMELGVFVGSEARGSAQAVYVAPLQAYLFFLTTYANVAGEELHFKLFDENTGVIHDLTETMYFTPNQHQGELNAPVPFAWLLSHVVAAPSGVQSFDAQPNPFSSETQMRFVLSGPQEVTLTITDAQGREVVRR
ncbi:MAG: LamG domain-containing protein, partial [Saprospiraceae bacterium]|nr:LamG domain-containing protein [Saprospiraceae bacterium]